MKKTDTIKIAFKIFIKSGKSTSILLCVLYMAISLVPSGLLIVNKRIFEEFSAESFSLQLVCFLIAGYVFMEFISKLLSSFQSVLSFQASYRIRMMIQKDIHSKLLAMNYIEFDNPDTRDLISRVSSSVPGKSSELVFGFLDAFSMVIQIVFALIILMNIHWLIPVTLVFFTLPYVFLYKMCIRDRLTTLTICWSLEQMMKIWPWLPMN